MARIPLPSTVTPADTTLLLNILNQINDLSDSFGRMGGLSVFKDKTVPTSALQIVAKTINVVSNKSVTGFEEAIFSIDYPDYPTIPVVTATPIVTYSNTAIKNLGWSMSTITTSKATGIIQFPTAGIYTVDVNIQVIGLSPNYV